MASSHKGSGHQTGGPYKVPSGPVMEKVPVLSAAAQSGAIINVEVDTSAILEILIPDPEEVSSKACSTVHLLKNTRA